MPPAPTDLLNEDIKRLNGDINRLSGAIDRLTDKVEHALDKLSARIDDEINICRPFNLDVTQRLAELSTTLKIAGTIVGVLLTVAIYTTRNAYQTGYAEGEKVGALEATLKLEREQIAASVSNC
jgi:hypothetical protein